MDAKKMKLAALVVLAGLLILGLAGCKKKTEPPAAPAVAPSAADVQKVAAAAAENIEQKTCPIMGNPIDKNSYVEYQGKKVYFCCAGCKVKFEQEPEKYLAKLPQFSK